MKKIIRSMSSRGAAKDKAAASADALNTSASSEKAVDISTSSVGTTTTDKALDVSSSSPAGKAVDVSSTSPAGKALDVSSSSPAGKAVDVSSTSPAGKALDVSAAANRSPEQKTNEAALSTKEKARLKAIEAARPRKSVDHVIPLPDTSMALADPAASSDRRLSLEEALAETKPEHIEDIELEEALKKVSSRKKESNSPCADFVCCM